MTDERRQEARIQINLPILPLTEEEEFALREVIL